MFFEAGCGITPIVSLIRQSLEEQPKIRASLFYLNKNLTTTMFVEELGDLKNSYIDKFEVYYFFSQEKQDIEWLNDRLNHEKIDYLISLNLLPTSNAEYSYLWIC